MRPCVRHLPKSSPGSGYADLFQQIVREREALAMACGSFPDSVADIRADRDRDE
jgi:hypothetical protein